MRLEVINTGTELLLGQVINTPPGQNVQTNAAPLRVVGDIQAAPGSTVVAGGGGVLTVQRNHSGGGSIVDKRPAILIETNRAVDKAGLADHIATSSRRFNVGPTERVTASSLRALTAPGESGPAISVGAVNLATGEPSGGATWAVGKDGVMSLANTGTTPETPATGTGVKVYTTGDETYRVRPDGTVDAWGSGGANGSTFKDNAFSVVDNGDATKVLAFEVSGVSTGTTRTLTVPNASGTIPLLGSTQTWTGAQTFSSQAVTLAEIAAPSTPASGFGAVYVKTDGLLYFKNDAGTEHDLTATAAGGAATGDVKASLVAAAAVGWLECNGAAVSRTTYSALFAAIGTTFGPGDETTTFNLPDFRGRGLIGVGTGTGLTARTLGQQTIGAETVTLGSGEMPSHSHGVNISDSGHSHGVNDSGHTHANTSHSHGVTDPGHFHYITRNLGGGGGLAGVTWTTAVGLTNSVTALTLNSTTGISIDSATVSTPSATTGVTTQSGTTGITGSSNSTGGGGSHANMQPSAAVHWFVKT